MRLNKAASVAGIIHAGCIVQRLMPENEKVVKTKFIVTKEEVQTDHHNHSVGHTPSHCHDEDIVFYKCTAVN